MCDSSFLDSLHLPYLLRETHRTPYEEIHRVRIQGLVKKTTRYTFFEDEKTRRIKEEIDRTDRDASIEGRVTNQEIASLRRAEDVGNEVNSILPSLYPGGFDYDEEFSRSMDGRKGPFFENLITYNDPCQVLSSGRELQKLLQYLVAPQRAWYANDVTPEYDSDEAGSELEDQDVLYDAFSGLSLNFSDIAEESGDQHESRKSDAIVVTDRPDLVDDEENTRILIFSEHRSSVTTGGQTARASLFDKLRALIDVLSSDEQIVSIPATDALDPEVSDATDRLPDDFEFDATYTLYELLDRFSIDHVYIYVGTLFNKGRGVATVDDDQDEGRLSEYGNQVNEIIDKCERMDLSSDRVGTDTPDIDITVSDPDGNEGETSGSDLDSTEAKEIHLRFTYGDEHIAAVYNGPTPESPSQVPEYTDRTITDVFEEIDLDDLWLNYSVSKRERQASSILNRHVDDSPLENNATQLARTILNDESSLGNYVEVQKAFYSESPSEDALNAVLLSATETLAQTYVDATSPDGWPSHEDQLQNVYPDDPLDAARYVALHALTYDLLVHPLFTKRSLLPESETDRMDASEKLDSAREGLATYVLQPVDSYARPNRAAVYRTIREHTTYSGTPSDSEDITVDNKLSADSSTVSEIHGSILNRLEEEDVIAFESTAEGDFYYIPPEVAAYTDKYLGGGND